MEWDIDEVEWYDSLANIGEKLNISSDQMNRWAEEGRNNGFPEPVTKLGRFKVYDEREVVAWIDLWLRLTKKMNRGEHLNGTGQGS
jgi:predicted DNA-binding transcriptional regulator AlpA